MLEKRDEPRVIHHEFWHARSPLSLKVFGEEPGLAGKQRNAKDSRPISQSSRPDPPIFSMRLPQFS
jgi:hypothetical protein